ncbi:SAM-dependent methyltransferase [Beijerinckia sp. L45]|uniref:SAM-dependent methyltransferase n=1 Tax=Beijerinckia sp. L45 TaxID=1641855 RepID=UPI00131CD625|nr:SAM-dependent methyltransferase [Beijerinckia sp. L45]
MSRHEASLPATYFDALYAEKADPWHFATSDYEGAKYAATLAALPKPRYRSALEVGCSIGVLTQQLAERCDRLLALDIAALALDQARERCAALGQVTFEQRRLPAEWPEGRFGLILLSEVVYYLDQSDVQRLAEQASTSIADGGDVVLVHWLGETHYPLTGDAAANLFIEESVGRLKVRHQARTADYRLDVLSA